MRLSVFALLSISCCTGLLPRCRTGLPLSQHTSRLDRLGITTASAAEPAGCFLVQHGVGNVTAVFNAAGQGGGAAA